MVAHGHEQVEEELAALFHLGLHGSAPLECLATSDDQSEIMGAEPRVCVGCVVVGVLRRTKDGADVDAALQALLPERQALEFFEAESLGGTVDYGVSEEVLAHTRDVHGGLDGSAAASGGVRIGGVWRSHGVLELPRVAVLVVQQAGVVVALVEVLENGREDLGFFVGKRNPLALRIEVLVPADALKER